ncbi:YceI family protein [Gordonia sputi]|uniref:Lipid/polyisoprenoid-binding YceI-like domain-containing protein n=1 Tax=Gordonia sputi NBRC 100414 TaxID=1089453 RepID=H5U376_9ACTN|nr:YceI family protein [Gordonia sputi]NKY93041.1 YceI family protein [Gordonia sputi]GAB40184.1 hypothetical protein GOSPT_089_00690 [Gordonia sputi NBRC 100414]
MKRRYLWWGLGTLVALIIVVVAAGPWAYSKWIAGDADEELKLPTSTQAASESVDGAWTVVPGPSADATRTQAGYRVDETLRGQPVTVNGRTTSVTGTATVASSKLENAEITVDVASITSPESMRDNRFRGESIMDTEKYPTATWKLTQPVDISSVPESGQPQAVQATGDITIKGVTKSATTTLNIQRSGASVIVQGSIPVTWTDFGVTPPSLGFVEVEKTGSIEFLVNLEKK